MSVSEFRLANRKVEDVNIGDSSVVISNKIFLIFTNATEEYYSYNTFNIRLPKINEKCLSVWETQTKQQNGWPIILFAVFDTPKKEKLVDLIMVSDRVKPMVKGLYQTNIEKVRPGMPTDKIYEMLGAQSCNYQKNSQGKWMVSFHYYGFRGRIYEFIVDASSGLVVSANEVTI